MCLHGPGCPISAMIAESSGVRRGKIAYRYPVKKTKTKAKAKPVAKKKKPVATKKQAAPNKKKPAKKPAAAPKKKPVAKKKTAAAKQPKQAAPLSVNVTLWEPIQPIDRGERYEDPVFAALEEAGVGGPGDGGGTLMGKDGEISEVDFDFEAADPAAVKLAAEVLEDNGAPKGSQLRYEHAGKEVTATFGITECVAIYLDGVNLPNEVYQSTSAQELVDKLCDAAGDDGEFRHSFQGKTETSLFFYSLDAEALYASLEPALRGYPLSATARVIVRYGKPELKPREIRLG